MALPETDCADFLVVWEFLRGCGLPYCSLYDDGYTSLGNRKNTVRNEMLRCADGTYLPAHMLRSSDEHLERINRTSAEGQAPAACPVEPLDAAYQTPLAVRVRSGSMTVGCKLLLSLQSVLESVRACVTSADIQIVSTSSAASVTSAVDLCHSYVDNSVVDILLCDEHGKHGAIDFAYNEGKDAITNWESIPGTHWRFCVLGQTLILCVHSTDTSSSTCKFDDNRDKLNFCGSIIRSFLGSKVSLKC